MIKTLKILNCSFHGNFLEIKKEKYLNDLAIDTTEQLRKHMQVEGKDSETFLCTNFAKKIKIIRQKYEKLKKKSFMFILLSSGYFVRILICDRT